MPEKIALGFRVLKGGSVVVGVAVTAGEPRLVLSTFLATAEEGDRLTLEPYHIAAETARTASGGMANAKAVVAEGRRRQDALAVAGLNAVVESLQTTGKEVSIAALLINRAGWVTDLLEYSLAFADHPPVAEGLAVRDAIRFALGQAGIAISEVDEKSLPAHASDALGLTPAEIDAHLKRLGTTCGKPWRKEQKLACLAAWTTLPA